ncbi:hypothetical protein NBRC116602_11670 [Hyphomicrobiales bacterium 4NK60-0047b]
MKNKTIQIDDRTGARKTRVAAVVALIFSRAFSQKIYEMPLMNAPLIITGINSFWLGHLNFEKMKSEIVEVISPPTNNRVVVV